MKRLLTLSLIFVSCVLVAPAQGPPTLDVFTSPDGGFQFLYPQTYELLVGDRILRATQGKHVGIPVCDFSTALACIVYPIEIADESRFEAAGFSVNLVPGVSSESDCLNYADQQARSRGEAVQASSAVMNPMVINAIVINDHEFRHATVRKTLSGHSQESDLHRTFHRQKCYELQIEVSVSEEPAAQSHPQTVSPENARAYSARESLRLILSSFSFMP